MHDLTAHTNTSLSIRSLPVRYRIKGPLKGSLMGPCRGYDSFLGVDVAFLGHPMGTIPLSQLVRSHLAPPKLYLTPLNLLLKVHEMMTTPQFADLQAGEPSVRLPLCMISLVPCDQLLGILLDGYFRCIHHAVSNAWGLTIDGVRQVSSELISLTAGSPVPPSSRCGKPRMQHSAASCIAGHHLS